MDGRKAKQQMNAERIRKYIGSGKKDKVTPVTTAELQLLRRSKCQYTKSSEGSLIKKLQQDCKVEVASERMSKFARAVNKEYCRKTSSSIRGSSL